MWVNELRNKKTQGGGEGLQGLNFDKGVERRGAKLRFANTAFSFSYLPILSLGRINSTASGIETKSVAGTRIAISSPSTITLSNVLSVVTIVIW